MLARTAFAAPAGGCQLDSPRGKIQPVIEIVFDNTHFTRGNPNVPSDLEQKSHLPGFTRNAGARLIRHHTALVATTVTDPVTARTGLHGDRHGVPASNSSRSFLSNGTTATVIASTYST